MSDKEREARIMVAGVAFIRYFNELREGMERFPLEFIDAYVAVIQKQPALYQMDGPEKLRIKHPLPEAEDRFNAARALLATLAPNREQR